MPVNIHGCRRWVPTVADLGRGAGTCFGPSRRRCCGMAVPMCSASSLCLQAVQLLPASGWRSRRRAPKNGRAVRSHRATKLGKNHLVYFTVWMAVHPSFVPRSYRHSSFVSFCLGLDRAISHHGVAADGAHCRLRDQEEPSGQCQGSCQLR
jgi:hypothetical protein